MPLEYLDRVLFSLPKKNVVGSLDHSHPNQFHSDLSALCLEGFWHPCQSGLFPPPFESYLQLHRPLDQRQSFQSGRFRLLRVPLAEGKWIFCSDPL